MADTLYLHLEFLCKDSWSINLPFLCTKCGNCCNLEDFLSAGKISSKAEDFPEIKTKLKVLYDELGKLWELNETKYDRHLMQNKCPFLNNNVCSIYEIRPEGCRDFPNTAFGMESADCAPLARFRRMQNALKRGRKSKGTYYFTGRSRQQVEQNKQVKISRLTEKQFQSCVTKLRKAGMTDDEYALLNCLNVRV